MLCHSWLTAERVPKYTHNSFIMSSSKVTVKGQSHKSVLHLKYHSVRLTTVRWELSFSISECNSTSPLVTSQILQEGRGVPRYLNLLGTNQYVKLLLNVSGEINSSQKID